MNKQHIIEEVVFDISFDSTAVAREEESELASFIQNRLLPMADDIFSELSTDGMVSKIDRLEIDLGDINYSNFRGEMESRFRVKLEEILRNQIQLVMTTHSPIEGVVSRAQVECGHLERYLETGRMALNANQGVAGGTDEMLQRAVRNKGDAFAEFLKKTQHRDIVVKRLTKQFPDQLMAEIMQLFTPTYASYLGNLVAKFGKTWKPGSNGISEKELKSLIWERLINEHLKSGSSITDPARLFRDVSKGLFFQHAKPPDVSDMVARPYKNKPGLALGNSVQALPLVAENCDGISDYDVLQAEAYPAEKSDARLLQARLESALVQGNAGELSGIWGSLLLNHAGIVRNVFKRRMGDECARDKLVRGFPEDMLHDLIRMLAPMESSFMEALSKQPELHKIETGATSSMLPFLWKHTFGYLHAAGVNAEGHERSDYVRSLFRYLIENGMEQRNIALAIFRVDSSLAKTLSESFDQGSFARKTVQSKAPRLETDVVRPIRAEALRQRLIQRLSAGRHEGVMAQEIEVLVSTYPETLEHLCRQLQAGEIHANVGELTEREAEQLIVFFVGLNQGGQESEFLRAIETYAKRAKNEQHYYQYILENLIHNQPVDLEKAAQTQETITASNEAVKHQVISKPLAVADKAKAESTPVLIEPDFSSTHATGKKKIVDSSFGTIEANHAEKLYQHITLHLNDGGPTGSVAQNIEILASRHPETFVRLYQQNAQEMAQLESTFPALITVNVMRSRLAQALVLGRKEGIADVWGILLLNHADMIRDVFILRMNTENARKKLANGFPDFMLYDLVRILAPIEGGFIEALAKQPELQGSQIANANVMNTLQWEYTLAYLHDAGLSGHDRCEYAHGLIQHLAKHGLAKSRIWQAIIRADPAMGEALNKLDDEAGRTDEAYALSGTMRADELYQQVAFRLSGKNRLKECVQELIELASTYPEMLIHLYGKLQTGQVNVDVSALTSREAWQHIEAFIIQNHGVMGESFRREIETHADKARDKRCYFQNILEKLVRNQIVDIEDAMGAGLQGTRQEESFSLPNRTEKIELPEDELLRTRLESAMVQGNARDVSGIWDRLCRNHADLVREIFFLRMGDEHLMKKLAEGFSDAMLFDLIRLIEPRESRFVEMLAKQVEFRAESTIAENTGSTKLSTWWESTLSYLHVIGGRGFTRLDYLCSLIPRMAGQGIAQKNFLQAVTRVDPELGGALSKFVTEDRMDKAHSRKAEAEHAGEVYGRLARHLSGRYRQEEDLQDISQEIEVLARLHPKIIERLYRELQAGETPINIGSLVEGEAKQLIVSFISQNPDVAGVDFLREVEEQAKGEQNKQRYYQYILQKLIFKQDVDLEEAVRNLHLETAHEEIPPATNIIAKVAQPQTDHISNFLDLALAQGDAAQVSGIWGEICQNYSDLVRDVFKHWIADENAIDKLARGFPEAMLHDLIAMLVPMESRFMVALTKQPELHTREAGKTDTKCTSLWKHTLGYLHANRRYDRNEYVHSLVCCLTEQGLDRVSIVQAITRADPILGKELSEHLKQDNFVQETEANKMRLLDSRADNAQRAEALYQSLVWHLSDGSHAGEMTREIKELANVHPATFKRLIKQLQAGEIQANVNRLSFREAKQLTLSVIRLNRSEAASDFLHAIEAQAESAQSERCYYQHILEKLIHGQNVDLDEAAQVHEALTSSDGVSEPQVKGEKQVASKKINNDSPPALLDSPATSVRGLEQKKIVAIKPEIFGDNRAEALHQSLVWHLSDGSHAGEMTREIKELANVHPATFKRLIKQLQAGEIQANVNRLSVHAAKQLTLSIISLNRSGAASDFLHAIKAQAESAQNEQCYYQHILEKLIYGQNVDLDEAKSEVAQGTTQEARDVVNNSRQMRQEMVPNDDSLLHQTLRKPPSVVDEVNPEFMPEPAKILPMNKNGRDEPKEFAEEIYIANAGLVLVSTYLPQLFRMLGLTEEGKFKDARAAERAIHLLQYTVNESCDSPEFLLALNKILCGFVTGTPIIRGIELMASEQEAVDGMLAGVIANWSVIGNTSVQGLRESFLQRGGRLQLKGGDWYLKVEQKGMDVLLDRLPWSFSLIKHPWMTRAIHVEWR